MTQSYEYEVALSFAGEDRSFVERVAEYLRQNRIDVYYDRFYEVHFWGEDLIEKFDEIYGSSARYVVMFISEHYAKKMWTNFERRTALSRMIREETTYLLPARFDDTKLKGLRDSIAHIDLRRETPESFASKIIEKIYKTGSPKPLEENPSPRVTLIHAADVPVVLYSTSTWLAYQITQSYYEGKHYVWCSPDLSSKSLSRSYSIPDYTASISPLTIYRELSESVARGDRHNVKVQSNKAAIIMTANRKQADGVVTEQQLKEIVAIAEAADLRDFRPLLYVIPYNIVANMLEQVPASMRVSPLEVEYIIKELPRQNFDVIEF